MEDLEKEKELIIKKIISDKEHFNQIIINNCTEDVKNMYCENLNEKTQDIKSELEEDFNNSFKKFLNNFYSESIFKYTDLIEAVIHSPFNVRDKMLNEISKYDETLYNAVKSVLFTFDDIVMLDDRAIQKVLRDIDQQELAKAMKGASEEIRDKIFRNMSKRAAAMLQEDMDFMGPVRVYDVEEARDKIIKVIRRLEDNGDIVISRAGENELIN